jgi:SAM-dependent methyltransferase
MQRWDVELRAFVAESPLVRRNIVRVVSDFAETLPPRSRILDVGAGTAPYRTLFDQCDYETHDWSETQYSLEGGPDHVGDLSRGLDVASGSFDALLCTEVLEHVQNPAAAAMELRRLLRPGGSLAVTVPFVFPLHEEPHDCQRFTNHGLRNLLTEAGFRVRSVQPLGGWFSTFCLVLREQAFATQAPAHRVSPWQRVTGSCCLLLARGLTPAAPWLDRRLDRRRALPMGWAALADG